MQNCAETAQNCAEIAKRPSDAVQSCAEVGQNCAEGGVSPEGKRHFLTPGDLKVLTGYSHHGRQRTILDRHGIRYVLRANDSIVTTWGAVEAALTRTPEAPTRRRRDMP